ncbi:MAG: hypothetical protein U5N58_14645 [Actinomycetota bacterium]|nr:hypothetical protein [Actinomycetota bacterium]
MKSESLLRRGTRPGPGRDYQEADRIRQLLADQGVILEDRKEGTHIQI